MSASPSASRTRRSRNRSRRSQGGPAAQPEAPQLSDAIGEEDESSAEMYHDSSSPMPPPSRRRGGGGGGGGAAGASQGKIGGGLPATDTLGEDGGINNVGGVDDLLPSGQVGGAASGVVNGNKGSLSNVAGGVLGGGKGEDEEGGGGKSDTLRLRLDLNLEVEVTLKARIHGDLELALLTM